MLVCACELEGRGRVGGAGDVGAGADEFALEEREGWGVVEEEEGEGGHVGGVVEEAEFGIGVGCLCLSGLEI